MMEEDGPNNTKSKLHYQIRAALRKVSQWAPQNYEAAKLAQISPTIFKCNWCGCAVCTRPTGFTEEEAEIYDKSSMVLIHGKINKDHIDPVINPETGFIDWNTFINRMFPGEEGIQILCEMCHYLKTQYEKDIAKERKSQK